MYHISFSTTNHFNTAILIKEAALKTEPIQREYIAPLTDLGMDTSKIVAFSLDYAGKKKPTATCKHEYLSQLLPTLKQLGVGDLLCCDAEYFKTLTKLKQAEPHIGSVAPCAITGYEDMYVVYAVNYQQFFYNPVLRDKAALSFNALANHKVGTYCALGTNALRNASYPDTLMGIRNALIDLLRYDSLTCDIEAFSLKHYDSGIGTISFSIDQHTAVAFLCDYVPCDAYEVEVWDKKDKCFKKKIAFGKQVINVEVRKLLKWFFETYTGTVIWHNACFDAYILVYQLWMIDLLDQEGLLTGLDVMTKNFECTQLITYLATNSCAGNKLGLKEQAHAFTGNYAQDDVKDIRLIPAPILLQYNGTDTCATWYVMDKHYDTLVLDNQLPLYRDLFKPAVLDIIQMQLTGMCLDMDRVLEVEKKIQGLADDALKLVLNTDTLKKFIQRMVDEEVIERNLNYKKKVIDATEAKYVFNPNSGKQLIELLYTEMGLPVIDLTDTKLPATGGKTLKKLLNHTDNAEYKIIIQALRDFASADKILTTFIVAFKKAPLASDGCHYLFGSYKLGGTVSGRLSSSNPNMQNIPSGSVFAKLIKYCFIAPPGYVYLASDFNALEDVVNTLLTRDPNKEKVLIEGYDSHCYKMVHYWPHLFPNLEMTPKYINALKEVFDALRSASKPISFAMQYQGTWATLVKNCGFTPDEAKSIEANFLQLYAVSVAWVNARIEQASKDGYATAAFGLRIRTPVLSQVIIGNKCTPTEAAAEARTLGNALSGQSYGLLNTRASVAYMRKVRASKYRLTIRLCAHIHDAIYQYAKDNFDQIAWVNKHLIEAMAWQDLPELKHDLIHIGSALDIQHPTWGDAFTIPNGANAAEIKQVCINEVNKRKQSKK